MGGSVGGVMPTPFELRRTALAAVVLLMSSCRTEDNVLPGPAAAAEHNERLGRRYFEEVWNQGHLDVLDELLAPDYINHTPSTPTTRLAPTGRRIEVNQINLERVRNGRIAEHWRVTDELTLMRQLGVVE
jgi:predicted SnoaL-like aldol condensation-catalyzing enzyme